MEEAGRGRQAELTRFTVCRPAFIQVSPHALRSAAHQVGFPHFLSILRPICVPFERPGSPLLPPALAAAAAAGGALLLPFKSTPLYEEEEEADREARCWLSKERWKHFT